MMDTTQVTEILREGIWVAIKVCGPMLLLSMLVGVLLAIFQAVTQIHEQTLSFLFKVVVIAAVLLIGGGWMMENLTSFMTDLWSNFGLYLR